MYKVADIDWLIGGKGSVDVVANEITDYFCDLDLLKEIKPQHEVCDLDGVVLARNATELVYMTRKGAFEKMSLDGEYLDSEPCSEGYFVETFQFSTKRLAAIRNVFTNKAATWWQLANVLKPIWRETR